MVVNGFSFCGIHIKTLGLEYAPEIENTYVYKPALTTSHIETFEGHNGGYFYGSWKEPKEFLLRCVFEEKDIDKGIMSQIYSLFRVGRSGKLIFDRRPWCYYYATVTDPIEENFSNYRNGTLTIHMQAMYPFARSDIMTNCKQVLDSNTRSTDRYHASMMSDTAVFDHPDMELPTEYAFTLPTTDNTPVLLANPGTERAALGLEIAGDSGAGVVIKNRTTGQSCKMIALTKAKTTDVNKSIIVDPISGKTMLVGAGTKEIAFMYHEYGFLELEPAFPATRDLFVEYRNNMVSVNNILQQNLEGHYIFVGGEWIKIIQQEGEHLLYLQKNVSSEGKGKTMAIRMNEIDVIPITTMDISIRFIYKPTYS